MSTPALSVVVPALDERRALPELIDEIEAVCDSLARTWELIVVDDGSDDGTFAVLEELACTRAWLRALRLRTNLGKSAALAVGFAHSRGEIVITLDGDGQDDPRDIPRMIDTLGDDADLVCGWKRDRQDPLSRRLASRLFNRATAAISRVRLHDQNCGIKAYRGDCARSLELYGELHRFIPVLADQQGWQVAELPVNHRARRHGRSRFGLERYARGAMDLMTVVFIGRFRNRPLHLFGGIGLVLTLAGLVISIYLTILKIGGASIGQRPLLFLGVLLIVVGVQFVAVGLLGQLIVVVNRRGAGGVPEVAIEREVSGPDIVSGTRPAATETIPRG